jgi:hypothetical protein
MALENPWGARKIHAELAKLGIEVSLATVSRYLPKRPADPVRRQNWLTFMRNHGDAIAAMDFFVVPCEAPTRGAAPCPASLLPEPL